MTTLKKRLLIAAAALAILSCGAAIGNSASAAGADDGRDYRIALINADADRNAPPHHMKKDRPAPPPEYRHKDKKEEFKKHKKAEKKWKEKHEERRDRDDRGMRHGPRHGGPDGRHMPPPPPEKR